MIWILFFFFTKRCFLQKKGPKKGKRVRKIEVPTDITPEFELGTFSSTVTSGGIILVVHRRRPRRHVPTADINIGQNWSNFDVSFQPRQLNVGSDMRWFPLATL